MLGGQVGEFRASFSTKVEMDCEMKGFDGNNNEWDSPQVGSDVWSTKNTLFTNYNDTSHQEQPHQLVESNSIQHSDFSSVEKNISELCISGEQSAADDSIKKYNQIGRGCEANKIPACPTRSTVRRKLSPSCGPLDFSAVSLDDSLNDTLLQTPAGFYDKSLPFSGPSIPPLFERDESCILSVARSRCTSVESSSCGGDSVDRSHHDEWSTDDDDKMTTSTPCASPLSGRCSRASDTFSPRNVSDDVSRQCDRVVCSVLSHVIADDISGDTELFDSGIDTDIDSDRSNASSPNAKSNLNPLAPAFRVNQHDLHRAASRPRAVRVGSQPVVAMSVCPPVHFQYMQQPLASYIPAAYYASSRHTGGSRRTRQPTLMHFTPMNDGSGVWTQYSEPFSYPTMMYQRPMGPWVPYQQQVCVVPQSCVGFVKVDLPMVMPINSQLSMARRSRMFTSTHRHGGRIHA